MQCNTHVGHAIGCLKRETGSNEPCQERIEAINSVLESLRIATDLATRALKAESNALKKRKADEAAAEKAAKAEADKAAKAAAKAAKAEADKVAKEEAKAAKEAAKVAKAEADKVAKEEAKAAKAEADKVAKEEAKAAKEAAKAAKAEADKVAKEEAKAAKKAAKRAAKQAEKQAALTRKTEEVAASLLEVQNAEIAVSRQEALMRSHAQEIENQKRNLLRAELRAKQHAQEANKLAKSLSAANGGAGSNIPAEGSGGTSPESPLDCESQRLINIVENLGVDNAPGAANLLTQEQLQLFQPLDNMVDDSGLRMIATQAFVLHREQSEKRKKLRLALQGELPLTLQGELPLTLQGDPTRVREIGRTLRAMALRDELLAKQLQDKQEVRAIRGGPGSPMMTV